MIPVTAFELGGAFKTFVERVVDLAKISSQFSGEARACWEEGYCPWLTCSGQLAKCCSHAYKLKETILLEETPIVGSVQAGPE